MLKIAGWGYLAFSYFLLLISFAHAEDQWEKKLQDDPRVEQVNLKGVGCNSMFNQGPHDKDTALYANCTIFFKDETTFSATLRFCPDFETCDREAGRFKDMLVRVLKKKNEVILAKKEK